MEQVDVERSSSYILHHCPQTSVCRETVLIASKEHEYYQNPGDTCAEYEHGVSWMQYIERQIHSQTEQDKDVVVQNLFKFCKILANKRSGHKVYEGLEFNHRKQ